MMNTLAEADAFVKQARANGSIASVQGAAAEYAARKQSAAQARGQWIEQQEAAEAAFVQEIQAAAVPPPALPLSNVVAQAHEIPACPLLPIPSSPTGGDSTTPWGVGLEWLTGSGPRHHEFRDGDPFTELLQQHEHIEATRIIVANRLRCRK